jgi:hypothetical protein
MVTAIVRRNDRGPVPAVLLAILMRDLDRRTLPVPV